MAAVLGIPGLASGAPREPRRLTYQRAAAAGECPDEETLRAGVAGRLGYEPFDDAATSSLAVTIARAGDVLEATIESINAETGHRGQRRLVSKRGDCAELAAAVELAVAMAIDPLGLVHPGPAAPPPPAVASSPVPSPAPPVMIVTTPSPAQARPGPAVPAPGHPLHARAAVGVIGAVGAAPSTALGGTLQLEVRRGRASIALEGRADMTASVPLRVGSIETSLLTAGLVPCFHHGIFAGCALLTAGSLRAAGAGLVDARQVSMSFAAVGARVETEFPIGRSVFLRLHGDVLAPLTNVVLRVSGEAVWTNPPLSAGLGLGAGMRFL